jgi:hypothetical protein
LCFWVIFCCHQTDRPDRFNMVFLFILAGHDSSLFSIKCLEKKIKSRYKVLGFGLIILHKRSVELQISSPWAFFPSTIIYCSFPWEWSMHLVLVLSIRFSYLSSLSCHTTTKSYMLSLFAIEFLWSSNSTNIMHLFIS